MRSRTAACPSIKTLQVKERGATVVVLHESSIIVVMLFPLAKSERTFLDREAAKRIYITPSPTAVQQYSSDREITCLCGLGSTAVGRDVQAAITANVLALCRW